MNDYSFVGLISKNSTFAIVLSIHFFDFTRVFDELLSAIDPDVETPSTYESATATKTVTAPLTSVTTHQL